MNLTCNLIDTENAKNMSNEPLNDLHVTCTTE